MQLLAAQRQSIDPGQHKLFSSIRIHVLIEADDLRVGGLYDPALVPGHSNSTARKEPILVKQLDCTERDGTLISTWNLEASLVPGALVAVQCELVYSPKREIISDDGVVKFGSYSLVADKYVVLAHQPPVDLGRLSAYRR